VIDLVRNSYSDSKTGQLEFERQQNMASMQQGEPSEKQLQVFDLVAALNRVEGDRELLEELVRLFLEHYPRQLREIRDAWQLREAKRVHRSAHSLKSALGSLSAERSFEVAYGIEVLGREEKFAELESALARLDDELVALQAAMQEFLEAAIP
jgi:HPt (histidine-containing phosphotransfer) domain-containing protein